MKGGTVCISRIIARDNAGSFKHVAIDYPRTQAVIARVFFFSLNVIVSNRKTFKRKYSKLGYKATID